MKSYPLSTLTVLAFIAAAIFTAIGSSQMPTLVAPNQIKATYTVTEFATCSGVTGPGSNCTGLVYIRVRKPDGTSVAYYATVATTTPDPTKWTWQPLVP